MQGQPTSVDSITQLLQEYVSKYTVYNDIIILDTDGVVLARLDGSADMMGLRAVDPIIQETLASSDAYVETFGKTQLRPNDESALIYSKRIENPLDGTVIGILCLSFRFKNELEGIFPQFAEKR
ncbi:cell wall metabolism sensor histidine kinase WalK [Methylocucumis oryzae]|uniref:cell wall metabolism sensor histidine kinase WalK n=1 Tax=Methylocucumis oryzae TaxID=1632867 RepID=UPI001EF9DC73|nr:cell wall metabolism sensor histidine kinase WalK [Methylocucumis oryzae]